MRGLIVTGRLGRPTSGSLVGFSRSGARATTITPPLLGLTCAGHAVQAGSCSGCSGNAMPAKSGPSASRPDPVTIHGTVSACDLAMLFAAVPGAVPATGNPRSLTSSPAAIGVIRPLLARGGRIKLVACPGRMPFTPFGRRLATISWPSVSAGDTTPRSLRSRISSSRRADRRRQCRPSLAGQPQYEAD